MSSSVNETTLSRTRMYSAAIVAAGCNSSVFMVLPFVDGCVETSIVNRSGKTTIQKEVA